MKWEEEGVHEDELVLGVLVEGVSVEVHIRFTEEKADDTAGDVTGCLEGDDCDE